MTHNRQSDNSPEHHEVSSLIPWHVNDTLDAHERQRVEVHVAACAVCREDLAVQTRIFEGIQAQRALDYMPVASLKRLQARLDMTQAQSAPLQQQTVPRQAPSLQPARREPWRGWMAASVGALAIAIGVLAAGRWVQFEARDKQASYRTVTNSTLRPQGEVIRAVFSPTITLVELQQILDEAQLNIVSGPTEAGVYSLASNSSARVRSSLEQLRRHAAVRFAEETIAEPESGNRP
ncbi:MAG: zf-HC2 domain-containing protein [Pseudomonadota bacterium]|nr:zf-HC2 domain-containing protein [Pseudomonadota bacterium]